MKNNNDNDLEFEVGVLWERADTENHNSDTKFTNSLKRKLPDRVDILNESQEYEFISKMKKEMVKQISFEKSLLAEYYSTEEINTLINYKYNFILSKENSKIGTIDIDEFSELSTVVLHSRSDLDIENIYKEFVTPTKRILENKINSSTKSFDKAAVSLLCRSLIRRNNQLYGFDNQDEDNGFNIRNYIVSLILASKITVEQKLHLLYEIFDWDDGEGDGIDNKSIQLLSSTVMQRNLQYIPTYQVNNMVELLFDGEASWISSWIYSSYSAKQGQNVAFENALQGLNIINNQNNDISDQNIEEIDPIDLTEVFQDFLWKYHRFYGWKSFWFHPKFSPFSDLQQILKISGSSISLPKRKGRQYVLWIVYISNGVKRVFAAYYNELHQLISVKNDSSDTTQKEGINKILAESKYFWNIENYPKVVPKELFISKLLCVPYYSDFMRTESTMRCAELQDALSGESEPLEYPLFIHLVDKSQNIMLSCEMTNATNPEWDLGLTQMLKDSEEIGNFVGMRKGILVIRMSQVFKHSTLCDVEERVRSAIKLINESIKTDNDEIDDLDMDLFSWEFFKDSKFVASLPRDVTLEEIVKIQGNEFIYYPITKKGEKERTPEVYDKSLINKFDSYWLLEEIGSTNQWVPCKIHGKSTKELFIVELKGNKEGYKIFKQRKDLLFSKLQMQKYDEKLFDY